MGQRRGFGKFLWRNELALICAMLMILPQPAEASQTQGIEIVVLQGQNATHLVNYHRQEPLVVMVRVDGQPTKGVAVTFELPVSGPGGDFTTTRTKTLRAMTGKGGRLTAKGFMPNKELGSYVVRVTAEHQGRTAKTEVPQQNAYSKTAAADNRKFGNELVFLSAIVGGVLVVVAIIANQAQR